MPTARAGFKSWQSRIICANGFSPTCGARDVVTAQQATEAVTEYVDSLKAALDRREIIEIPSVGRIYRDYEKQLKFMPEGTNFEASSFGLPDVKFTPVERTRKTESATGATAPKVGKVAAATQAGELVSAHVIARPDASTLAAFV